MLQQCSTLHHAILRCVLICFWYARLYASWHATMCCTELCSSEVHWLLGLCWTVTFCYADLCLAELSSTVWGCATLFCATKHQIMLLCSALLGARLAVLCQNVLCCTNMCYAVPNCAIQCRNLLCYSRSCCAHALFCCAVLSCTGLYWVLRYYAKLALLLVKSCFAVLRRITESCAWGVVKFVPGFRGFGLGVWVVCRGASSTTGKGIKDKKCCFIWVTSGTDLLENHFCSSCCHESLLWVAWDWINPVELRAIGIALDV